MWLAPIAVQLPVVALTCMFHAHAQGLPICCLYNIPARAAWLTARLSGWASGLRMAHTFPHT